MAESEGIAFAFDSGFQLVFKLASGREALSRAPKNALGGANGLGADGSEQLQISRRSGAVPLLLVTVPLLPRRSFPLWESVAPARVLVAIVCSPPRSRVFASAIQTA